MSVRLTGFHEFEPLGEGGFAKVYRARQDGFERQVAVKVLTVGLDDRQRLAFERECRAMGTVSQHPHIVTVFSAGWTSDDEPAIVMELFERGTTSDLLRARGTVDHATVLDIGVKMCGALQTAHDRGLLHRDVKPQNIFLSEFDEPALGDFGIAAFADDEAGVAGFSIHYAAPEVIERRQADHLSDVYSLGATLYTLLAGHRPFATPGSPRSTRDVALRVLRERPPRLQGVPNPVADAVMAALAKRPEDRPASAASLGRRLQEIQDELGLTRTRFTVSTSAPRSEATTDEAPEPTATVARPSQRNRVRGGGDEPRVPRGRALASVAAALVAVVGLVGLGWFVVRDPAPEPVPTAVPTDPEVLDDDFFQVVAPPSEVRLARGDAGGVEVTWDHPGAARFEVQRVDADAESEAVEAVVADASPVVLEVFGAARPCVVVRAIGENGRVSDDTTPTCLGDATPTPTPAPVVTPTG